MMTQIPEIENGIGAIRSRSQVYHNLIRHRIREILLVATHYDAFILEQEELLAESIFDDYFKLNLSSAPRITSVDSGADAMRAIGEQHFDLVILMMRIADMTPFALCEKIKTQNPKLHVVLLLKDNAEISLLKSLQAKNAPFDNIFVWNGDSKVFVAIIKSLEDRLNVDNDTRAGMVRVILLVEDSIRYYSFFLPVLYVEIIKQVQQLISKESPYEQKKLLRMRARPKVLLAKTYEEAVALIEKYREYLLCVISDVTFARDGKLDETAGIELLRYVKSTIRDLPTALQSSDPPPEEIDGLETLFIDKNDDALASRLVEFFVNYLGFGDFLFRDKDNRVIARAGSLEELRAQLEKVPAESLEYHGIRNHFSAWLMARGEIQIAKKIQPIRVSGFSSLEELRAFLVGVFQHVREETIRGKVINFDVSNLRSRGCIVRLSDGALGGKGRGIAFLNYLIEDGILRKKVGGVPLRVPFTSIIGTEEFSRFISANGIDISDRSVEYEEMKRRFLGGKLSSGLRERLKLFLEHADYPLAVRSSSQFEDSLSQPFSGVYSTFLLPNDHPDIAVRFEQLIRAIKLVYASVFSSSARGYFDAINYRIEEEKMAVILQEVVGSRRGERFYPHFSGVAQSYNYYPISHMTPDDGVALLALGLGKYVVEGEKAFRFCPRYPNLDVLIPEDQLKYSQQHFYALRMAQSGFHLVEGEDATLEKLPLQAAEDDGVLDHLVSVWDYQNDRIQWGLGYQGPRIVNFADVLKNNYFPLADILTHLLEVLPRQLGTPVEIEFAVTLGRPGGEKPAFYLLQIKHFMKNLDDFNIDMSAIPRESICVYTEKGLGHGRVDDVYDVIFVNPETFDRTNSAAMTVELEALNKRMVQDGRKYVLIGPGRWGTRDRFLGIPIEWSQISNAKVIIEAGLENFQVDASMGSHFFHNITSMNVGYFSVPFGASSGFIDWEWLKRQPVATRTKYCTHIRLEKPLTILMDGRKGISMILKESLCTNQ